MTDFVTYYRPYPDWRSSEVLASNFVSFRREEMLRKDSTLSINPFEEVVQRAWTPYFYFPFIFPNVTIPKLPGQFMKELH